MTTTATKIDAIRIDHVEMFSGRIYCLQATVASYEQYADLPQVVEYQGTHYTKTSWNSDTMLACYKADQQVAYVN